VVVRLQGQQATTEEIRAHGKTLIAGYKAPRSVEFIDAMPMSGAGKILKRDLRKRYWGDDRARSPDAPPAWSSAECRRARG
jgi:acyl-CoA synthetase (AMP-forming)/AMP-acid ligase II